MFIVFLNSIICASWLAVFFFTAFFLFKFFKNEDKTQLIFLLLIAVTMLYANFTAPIRGGYDNNHDFDSISSQIWTPGMFSYKEASPIFLKHIADKISGNSLAAILTGNRLLPLFSMLIFYAGLRRSGAGKAGSLAGTVLLFLNFHTFLNASSLSTATSAAFIFITAIAALLDFYAKDSISHYDIAYIFSASILTAMSRIEHVPALCILGAMAFYVKFMQKKSVFSDRRCIFAFFAGILCLAICVLFQMNFNPQRLLIKSSFIDNFNMHMMAENFDIIFSPESANAFPQRLHPLSWRTMLLALFLAAGLNIQDRKTKEFFPVPCATAAAFVYFMAIYSWHDNFPLHFMRHRIFMLALMSMLGAYSIKAIYETALHYMPGQKKSLAVLIFVLCEAYSVLNVNTAKSLDSLMRTNDLEWALLLKAQPEIKGKYRIMTSDPSYQRDEFLKLYFSADMHSEKPLLFYASPDIYTFNRKNLQNDKWLEPFRTYAYRHFFHTTFNEESHKTIMVKPGFYKIKADSPKAKKLIMEGLMAISDGNFALGKEKADKLLNEDIGHYGHFFCLAAFAAANDEEDLKQETELFESNIVLYKAERIRKATEQIKNNPEALKMVVSMSMSSEPKACLDTIWKFFSFSFDERLLEDIYNKSKNRFRFINSHTPHPQ